jgi:hypothetical protein
MKEKRNMLSAVGGVSAQASTSQRPEGLPPMPEVAKLLGMSSSEVSGAMQSGSTLSGLASEKGASQSELVKTIETHLSAHKPEGAPELQAGQLTQMATSVANGTPPGPSPSGTHSHGGGGTLGMEAGELLEQLEEGLDTSSLLKESGFTSEGSSTLQSAGSGGIAFNQVA